MGLMSVGGGGLPYKEILYVFNLEDWTQNGILVNSKSVNQLSSDKSFSGDYLKWIPHESEAKIEVTALKNCKVRTYMSTDDGNAGPVFTTISEKTVNAGDRIRYDGPNWLKYAVCVL